MPIVTKIVKEPALGLFLFYDDEQMCTPISYFGFEEEEFPFLIASVKSDIEREFPFYRLTLDEVIEHYDPDPESEVIFQVTIH